MWVSRYETAEITQVSDAINPSALRHSRSREKHEVTVRSQSRAKIGGNSKHAALSVEPIGTARNLS